MVERCAGSVQRRGKHWQHSGPQHIAYTKTHTSKRTHIQTHTTCVLTCKRVYNKRARIHKRTDVIEYAEGPPHTRVRCTMLWITSRAPLKPRGGTKRRQKTNIPAKIKPTMTAPVLVGMIDVGPPGGPPGAVLVGVWGGVGEWVLCSSLIVAHL